MRIDIVRGAPTAAQALRLYRELFPERGRYELAKAQPAREESDPFETWFLRELEEQTRAGYLAAWDAIWQTLDALLQRNGVVAPSALEADELAQALTDLSRGATARMVGIRLRPDVVERLTALGWDTRQVLDFPALAYRMGMLWNCTPEVLDTHPTGRSGLPTPRGRCPVRPRRSAPRSASAGDMASRSNRAGRPASGLRPSVITPSTLAAAGQARRHRAATARAPRAATHLVRGPPVGWVSNNPLQQSPQTRVREWSTTLAVGSRAFVTGIETALQSRANGRQVHAFEPSACGFVQGERAASYEAIFGPETSREGAKTGSV